MVLSVTTVFSLRRVWCRTWRSSYPGPIPQWCQPDVWGWSYTSISLVPDQFGMSYWQRPSRSARKHKQVWDQATLKWACCQTLCFSLLTHIRSLLIFFLIHIILSTHISLIVSFFPLRTVLVGWSRDRQRQQHHLAGPGDGIYEPSWLASTTTSPRPSLPWSRWWRTWRTREGALPLAAPRFESLILGIVYSAHQAKLQEREEDQEKWGEVLKR